MMMHANDLSYGLWTPGLAYLASCLGGFLGLRCATRARAYAGAQRTRWLVFAAASIGVTGIWLGHFIAMLGFTMPDVTVLYNVPETLLSGLVAVAVVCVGMVIAASGTDSLRRLLAGGAVTGLGVATVHYTGMAAMRMPGTISYDPAPLLVSAAIAITGSIAALWLALRVRTIPATVTAALVLAATVSGMHYTGMAGLRMTAMAAGMQPSLSGSTAQAFLLPLILGISTLTFFLAILIALSPTADEIREDGELMARIAQGRLDRAEPPLS